MMKIKSSSVKKLLSEFGNIAKDAEKYTAFIKEYGNPLKEGLFQDFENRDTLLELVRFKSTKTDSYTSLADYKARMQPDQKAIYYITGEKETALRKSPLLEMYNKKDIEVLILADKVDEIVMPAIGKYKDIEVKSINKSDAADDLKTEEDKKEEKQIEPVIKRIKKALGDDVKDVKASTRLSDSPSCVVVDVTDPTVQMQEMMKAMGKTDFADIKPILEVNPTHPIVKKFAEIKEDALFEDISRLLLEQALLIEGVEIKDMPSFVKRLNIITEKALI